MCYFDFTNISLNFSSFAWFRSRKCWRIRFQRGRHYKFKKSSGRKLVWWRIERKIWILPSQLRYRDHPDPQVVVLEELLFPVKNRKCASALTGSSRGIWRRKRNTHWHYYTPHPFALPYRHLVANFWNRIGYWLLNKLLKKTFNWRKKYFFLELYHRFNLKSFIKSLIFKNFFSGWIALCLHLCLHFHLHLPRIVIESPYLS